MMLFNKVVRDSFYALVAQLDRVSVSEAEGRGFDSRRAHQSLYLQLLSTPP